MHAYIQYTQADTHTRARVITDSKYKFISGDHLLAIRGLVDAVREVEPVHHHTPCGAIVEDDGS